MGTPKDPPPTAEHLAGRLAEVLVPSSVIVCIGNELCGDDGAGVAVARELGDGVPWRVVNAETAPESFLSRITASRPGSVVLVDALHFGGRPGAVELLTPETLDGQGPSTHGPAPLAFLEMLRLMHPCRRVVVGIQPFRTEVGQGLSRPVRRAVGLVAEAFRLCATRGGR